MWAIFGQKWARNEQFFKRNLLVINKNLRKNKLTGKMSNYPEMLHANDQ
jgi:hypothetical protein